MRISAAFKAANPNHPHIRNPRRPRTRIQRSGGPGISPSPRRKPSRQLTTSEAAIRRSKQRRGIRGPSRPVRQWGAGSGVRRGPSKPVNRRGSGRGTARGPGKKLFVGRPVRGPRRR